MQPFEYQGEKFKEYLENLREENPVTGKMVKVSKTEAAKRMGIARETLYQYFESKSLSSSVVKKILTTFNVSEKEIWGEKSNAKPVKISKRDNLFFVPLKAYGGFLSGYENEVYANELERGSMPMIQGPCFAFEIEGFSMVPEYYPHDYIVTTRIESLNDLVRGRVYVFQTIDGIIVKCFDKIENDYLYLYSLNEEANPVKPLYLKEVKVIYQKEFKITKN